VHLISGAIPPGSALAVHVSCMQFHPRKVTLTSRIFSSGSLLVLRLNASSTPHAWTPRDLGFSPQLATGVWPGIHLSWPSSAVRVTDVRPLCIVEDTSAHPRDRCLTTLRYLGARALQDTDPCRSWDLAYVAPNY